MSFLRELVYPLKLVLSRCIISICFKALWYLFWRLESMSEAFLFHSSSSIFVNQKDTACFLMKSLSFWLSAWRLSFWSALVASYLIWTSKECLSRSFFSTSLYLHIFPSDTLACSHLSCLWVFRFRLPGISKWFRGCRPWSDSCLLGAWQSWI